MSNRQVEILAPAGSYESLMAAVSAGADAVYIGGMKFGARAYANNLDEEKMLEAIDYVHLHGRKIYMTVNTLLKDDEINELYDYLLPYYKQGLDAVIVQDVGVFDFVKTNFPDLPIHISTQMTVTNESSALFFKDRGAERVVPARELNLREIREMKDATGLEIECFVHGALCYCYSGQCLLSSMIGGRSGNRGQCAQPCRLPYGVNGKKPQDILSLKDLCTIEMIPELIEAGIDSFKIEGRMKQPEYVYTVVSMYRKYVDLYLAKGRKGFQVSREDIKALQGIFRRRGYCEGYYKQHNGKDMISLKRPEDDVPSAQMPDFKIQEKVSGKLRLSEGNPAEFELLFGEYRVFCEGAVVQSALKQPLDRERIDKQMRKTGATQFQLDTLEIEIEGSIFLPMQALNELRRDALDRLEEAVLMSYRRAESVKKEKNFSVKEFENKKDTLFAVSVQEYEQLKVVLNNEYVSAIYVDSKIAMEERTIQLLEQKDGFQKIFVAMPYIFRSGSVKRYENYYQSLNQKYDGALIRNWESYQWLLRHGYQKEIVTDYNLYVFNQWGKNFLKETEVSGYTAPVELNVKELNKLDVSDASLIVYGYQPVMFSAGCVQKNTDKCTQKEGILYLTDRYQKKFAVKNYCNCCYNVVYNSLPLMLLNNREDIERLNPAVLRLDFSLESKEETKQMLDLYAEVFIRGENVDISGMDYTRGHFKRGVK